MKKYFNLLIELYLEKDENRYNLTVHSLKLNKTFYNLTEEEVKIKIEEIMLKVGTKEIDVHNAINKLLKNNLIMCPDCNGSGVYENGEGEEWVCMLCDGTGEIEEEEDYD